MHRLLVLIAFIPFSASADQINDGRLFSLLCATEMSGGFNWIKDHWQQAVYKPSTYILRKLNASKDAACIVARAVGNTGQTQFSDSGYGESNGCYTWTEIGENPKAGLVCEEFWQKENGLYRIQCGGYDDVTVSILSEEVIFVDTRTYSVFSTPIDDERDSMVLAFGKCSFVN